MPENPSNPYAGTHPKENGQPFDPAALAASIRSLTLRPLPRPPVSEYHDAGHDPQGSGGGKG